MMGTHWSTTQLGGWMMDVHLVDLISFVHEPWPRQIRTRQETRLLLDLRAHPDAVLYQSAKSGERLYNCVNKLPYQLVGSFLILCRIVRTGLRNRGISRYRDPPVVSYRTNQRLVYDRGVRDFC